MPPVAAPRSVAVFSWGMWRTANLATLSGAKRLLFRPRDASARKVDAVMVWGRKSSGRPGRAYARRHSKPVLQAEDGFLRSIGLGVSGAPPLSLVLDDLGIYYDATTPSRLERWLAEDDTLEEPALLRRADAAMQRIVEADLSKYNQSPPGRVSLGDPDRPRVMVVDQTFGDESVRCGLADARTFSDMLDAACDENPDAEILVKTHPDVLSGKKKGYLGDVRARPRVKLFTQNASPYGLLAQVRRVYCVTSQLGFEALLAGCRVDCFGAPWYAGWSQTNDRIALSGRGRKRPLAALFAAAYLRYTHYLNPVTGGPGEIEDVIEHLARQRRVFAENRGRHYCFGFRFWKHGYMKAYLRCPGNEVHFPRSLEQLDESGALDREGARFVVWGQREPAALRDLAEKKNVPICRVEDGFLRSVGLGSDLAMPASLVFDGRGIYYDPSGRSDLEHILQTADFDDEERTRARALRARIVDAGLSKYNVGEDRALAVPEGRYVVLVPGQVEDDASVRLGSGTVKTNLGLLEAAREAHPDAYIIFKPHPDVLSGNRRGAVDEAAARRVCDDIETEASLAQCLAAAEEIHTMTSLVGFEGLLRGRRVVVYGLPFYAGWGLTEDHAPCERRTRELTLDELVAGALLRYPRYLDRERMFFITPEITIDQLLAERDGSDARRVEIGWWRRQLRKVRYAYRGWMQGHAS